MPESQALSAAVFSGSRAGVEVAGDHDADRLDPAWHIEHLTEAALDEHILLAGGLLAARPGLAGLFNTEELEPFVILVEAACHRREVAPTSPNPPRRRATLFAGPLGTSTPAAPSATPRPVARLTVGPLARTALFPRPGRLLRSPDHAVADRQRLVVVIDPVATLASGPFTRTVGGPASGGIAADAVLGAAATAATPAAATSATATRLARIVGGTRFSVRSRLDVGTTGQGSLVDDVEFVILGIGFIAVRGMMACRNRIAVSAMASIAAAAMTKSTFAECLFATAGHITGTRFAAVFPLARTFSPTATAATAPPTPASSAASFARGPFARGPFVAW